MPYTYFFIILPFVCSDNLITCFNFFEHFERECYVSQRDKTHFEGEFLLLSTLVFSKTNHQIFILHLNTIPIIEAARGRFSFYGMKVA